MRRDFRGLVAARKVACRAEVRAAAAKVGAAMEVERAVAEMEVVTVEVAMVAVASDLRQVGKAAAMAAVGRVAAKAGFLAAVLVAVPQAAAAKAVEKGSLATTAREAAPCTIQSSYSAGRYLCCPMRSFRRRRRADPARCSAGRYPLSEAALRPACPPCPILKSAARAQ